MSTRTVPTHGGRIAAGLALAAAGLLVLSACSSSAGGGGGGTSPKSSGSTSAAPDKYAGLTEAQLYAAAKKEGTINLYASDSGTDMYPAFEKAYPGIKVKYFQEQGEDSASKMASEARAGVYNVDDIDTEQNTAYALAQAGLLATYTAPQAVNLPAQYKTQWFSGYRIQLKPISYNTDKIKGSDIPTDFSQLTDPKYKGKICAEPTEVSVFADMVQKLGQSQTVAYWKALTKNGLRFVSGQTNLVESVVNGDCPIAVIANLHTVAKDMAKGAPVNWVKTDPMYGNYGAVGVAAKAPHPYAARLYADFTLSTAGQATVVDAYRVPANSTVSPKEPQLANHNYTAYIAGASIMENFTKYNDLYYTTTGRPVVSGD